VLAGAAAAWSVTWIGVVLAQSGLLDNYRVGYWSVLVSLGVVIVGTIVIGVSAKRTTKEKDSAGPRTSDGVPLG
jgi:hypothetical protein